MASRPVLGWVQAPDDPQRVASMDVWVMDQGTLLTVNDNGGQLYGTQREPDGSYVVTDQPGAGIRGAIGEVRVTDALMVLPREVALEGGAIATLAHQCPSGLAGMHSFGEALRRSAQALLDVEPSEITVGLQARRVGDLISANIYVADTLENGAGYAVELGKTGLLPVVEAVSEGLAERWSDPEHLGCDSACPDCLRSYDNRHLHPLLDWRLALDVADLCLGRKLDTDRWLSLAPGVAENFVQTYHEALEDAPKVIEAAGLTGVRSGERALLLSHPLWRRDQQGWNEAQRSGIASLQSQGLASVAVVDLRTARNYPESMYGLLR